MLIKIINNNFLQFFRKLGCILPKMSLLAVYIDDSVHCVVREWSEMFGRRIMLIHAAFNVLELLTSTFAFISSPDNGYISNDGYFNHVVTAWLPLLDADRTNGCMQVRAFLIQVFLLFFFYYLFCVFGDTKILVNLVYSDVSTRKCPLQGIF